MPRITTLKKSAVASVRRQNGVRKLPAMMNLMSIMSVQLVCLTTIVTLLLFHVARRTWIMDQHRQQSLLRDKLIQQRDDVSRRLNDLQEQHQQLICQLVNRSTSISETGGWCDAAVHSVHVTDSGLAGALAELFGGRSVAGLGDGRGDYRRLILDSGLVRRYDAYDGAPNIHNITAGKVKFLDLTLPQYWLPRYDWVLSMEVLEHISLQFETVVLDNIDRAAGYGAVLSWASPGQSGFHHVNNRPAEYLNKVMKQRGFQLDLPTSQKLRSISRFPWLKRNLMVFYRM